MEAGRRCFSPRETLRECVWLSPHALGAGCVLGNACFVLGLDLTLGGTVGPVNRGAGISGTAGSVRPAGEPGSPGLPEGTRAPPRGWGLRGAGRTRVSCQPDLDVTSESRRGPPSRWARRARQQAGGLGWVGGRGGLSRVPPKIALSSNVWRQREGPLASSVNPCQSQRRGGLRKPPSGWLLANSIPA